MEREAQLFQPFQKFYRFLKDCTGHNPPEYCSTCELEIGGKKIAFLGINSAWMCGRHKDESGNYNDQGYLCIGEPQIYGPLEQLSKSDIRIAILHHPLDWLTPFDLGRVEVYLKRKCNFILHGHAHKPGASANRDNFGYYITVPAGACYDRSIPSNSDYTYSYNYVHLDFDTDKGFVFLRRWSNLNRVWWKDDETCPPNGEFPFSISGLDKAPIPHQIPPPPRDFKGREDEIRDILSNFEKGATITGLRGMAGIGKTALAFVLADRLKCTFPDGQLLLNLKGTDKNPLNPTEAMAQVVRAYNPTDRLPEDECELRGLYLSVLAGKNVLLLLDNAANKEQVEPLLPPIGCAVLVTSRNKFVLPGLREKDLDVLPAKEACELLLEIAGRIENRAEELAKLCGYLPLALRNAASILAERKDISVAEYERRLREKRVRLELVEASFSLSFDLLPSIKKRQWCRLSVFPEDFDRNGAAAVWMLDRQLSAEALSYLVKWSLLDFISYPDSEEGRYKLHDLSRIFADSRLEPSERADSEQRYAKYYLKVLSEANRLYQNGGKNIIMGLELFDRDWTNIRSGQILVKGLTQNSGKTNNKTKLKFALRMASSYASEGANILELRLHPHDRIYWLEIAIKAAQRMGDRNAMYVHLNNLANTYLDIGEASKAIEYYEQDLAIARKNGNHEGEGILLGNLGIAHKNLGEVHKAIEYYKQGIELARKNGTRQSEGNILGNLGNAYSAIGEIRRAIEYHEQNLAIAREIGNRRGEGSAMGNLGNEYANLGEIKRAIAYYEQSFAIACEIGDRKSEGNAKGNLGLAYSHLGKTRKAIEYYEQALAIIREIGDKGCELNHLGNLGMAYAGLGETEKAIELNKSALALHARSATNGEKATSCATWEGLTQT